MTSLKSNILNATDLPVELIHVPRWDQDVLVRAAPIASPAYVGFVSSTKDRNVVTTGPNGVLVVNQREADVRRNIGAVILCALDPDTRERIFEWSDAKELREKHWNSVLLIATKAFELAGGDGPEEVTAHLALMQLIAYGVRADWPEDIIGALTGIEALIDITVDAEVVEAEIEDDEDPEDDEVSAAVAAVDPEVEEAASEAPKAAG